MNDENLMILLRHNRTAYDNNGLAYAEPRNPEGELAAAAIERLTAELAAERRDHEATKIGHSLAMKRAAEEARQASAELAATRAALQYARNLIGPDEIIDAALKGNE
jgi:hypothetical protein